MEAVRDILSANIDPDSLGELCEYVDPNFESILFEQWQKLQPKDLLYFSITYSYLPMLRLAWNSISVMERNKLSRYTLGLAARKEEYGFIIWLLQNGCLWHPEVYQIVKNKGLNQILTWFNQNGFLPPGASHGQFGANNKRTGWWQRQNRRLGHSVHR